MRKRGVPHVPLTLSRRPAISEAASVCQGRRRNGPSLVRAPAAQRASLSASAPGASPTAPDRAEGGADLGDERRRHFHRGEVATTPKPVEVDEVRLLLAGPALGDRVDVAGEGA